MRCFGIPGCSCAKITRNVKRGRVTDWNPNVINPDVISFRLDAFGLVRCFNICISWRVHRRTSSMTANFPLCSSTWINHAPVEVLIRSRELEALSVFFSLPLMEHVPKIAKVTAELLRGSVGFLSDIQEFYELTLLDDTKSVQEKTAETIRIANKWETSDGLIAPPYTNNDVSTESSFIVRLGWVA